VPEVRLIDAKGAQLGVVPTAEALRIAKEQHTDLVEVAPLAEPPVCRLLNYGKFLYERAKKDREARKSQKQTEIKEIRLRPKTGEHDIDYKMRDARRFLAKGFKVKVRIRFRGREITHPELAKVMLDRVAQDLGDVATVEQEGRMEGPTMLMILAPGK
jgi:translation initiation factor IF-3